MVMVIALAVSRGGALAQEAGGTEESRLGTGQKLERSRGKEKERPVQILEPPVIRLGREHQGKAETQERPESLMINRMTEPREGYRKVFSLVEDGLATGVVNDFAAHFDSQVSVNLRGGESGYYSANQAYYVLESYLKARKFGNFEFTTFGKSESNPYATGSARFTSKGGVEIVQVYVSLSWVGERWVISQFKIY
jgi:hypothetical protein